MNRPHFHIFAANAVFKALMPMIFLCTFVTTDIVLSIQMTPSLFPLPHLSPELSPLRPRRVIPTCTSTSNDGSSLEDMNSCSSPLDICKTSGNSCGSESSSSLDDDGDGSLSSSSADHLDNFVSMYPVDEEEEDSEEEDSDSDISCNGYEFYNEDTFPAGVDDVVHVGLAQLCRKIKAPLYAYNEILSWAQSAKLQGYSFSADAPHYRTFISSLKKRLDVADYAHKTSTVIAPGGGTVSFPVFQFETMFLSLIDDPRIKDHLLLNWDDPCSPTAFDSGSLDEIHSGLWYELTSAKLVKSNSNEVLCGIILAVDRTHVADKDKLSLEPVLFSLSIIPRALRNHPFAWRPLGFIPKLPSSKTLGFNAITYHRVLSSILSGLVTAQRNGGIKASLLHDGLEEEFCFKVPLAFVIGDVEGHDVLCGRYHTHSTKQLSRECNCSMDDADNHEVECEYIKASHLRQLRESCDNSSLKALCFHNVKNAFDDVCFGANEFGIHRATMSEVLHAIQKGWYIYTLQALYGMLSGTPLDFLDCLARRVSRQCRHQSDRNFPRLTFPNGIKSYKMLHAHEISGLLLLLTICLHCHIGWDKNHTGEITKNSFVRNTACSKPHILRRLKHFRALLQMLLCMEAWMKQDSVDRKVVSSRLLNRKPYQSTAKEAL